MEPTIKKLIAIYARVSTSLQENEGTIENQLMVLREYAQKNGCTIMSEYIDDGWSGDILARPELDRLRQDIKIGMWEAVLIYDPDRLARRYSYQELVMDELREAGKEVIFITVSAPKNHEEKVMYGMRGIFAEWERMKITERFRLGKLRKVKEGHILLSEAAYGYKYVPLVKTKDQGKIHGYLEIFEPEARVVRMIFNWVGDEALTLRKVVLRLKELGIKPRKSKRGVWNTSTLLTLVRNPVYIGMAKWGSSYAVVPTKPLKDQKYRKIKKTSRKMKPKDEWILINVPPIIEDRALFDRVERQLAENFALARGNRKNNYLLSGRIWCTCNRTRTGEGRAHGRYIYYRCSDRVLSFPLPPNCHEGGINARIADKKVWEKIVSLMSSPKLLSEQVTRWSKSRESKTKNVLSDTFGIEKEVEVLKTQEERYNKAYGAGVYTLEDLKSYLTPIKEKRVSLELQLSKAKNETQGVGLSEMPDEAELCSIAKDAQRLLNEGLSFEQKRSIVLDVIDKVVGTQGKLTIYGHIPITPYGVFSFDDRYCRAAQRGQKHSF